MSLSEHPLLSLLPWDRPQKEWGEGSAQRQQWDNHCPRSPPNIPAQGSYPPASSAPTTCPMDTPASLSTWQTVNIGTSVSHSSSRRRGFPLLEYGVPHSKVVLLVVPCWAPAALQKWSCPPPPPHAIPTGLPSSWCVFGCSGEGQDGCAGRGHRRGYGQQTTGYALSPGGETPVTTASGPGPFLSTGPRAVCAPGRAEWPGLEPAPPAHHSLSPSSPRSR